MQESDLREVTATIVTAYIGNNAVARADLPEVVKSVAGALSGLSEPKAPTK